MVLSLLLLQTTGVLINCNKTEKLIIAIKEKANIWYKRKKNVAHVRLPSPGHSW